MPQRATTARSIRRRRRLHPSCASCHTDHRGAIRLAATSDANCAQCHANLTTRGASTNFARNIHSFEGDHPEFAVLRVGRGDPATIQLNHYRHLQSNLLGPNGSRVQMVCADCHRSAADANVAWPYGSAKNQTGTAAAPAASDMKPRAGISSRAYMAPATYVRTCAACHTLQFDKRIPDAVPHDKPEVIHPFVVAKFQSYIAAHPAEFARGARPSRDLPEKPIPADYRLLTPPQWVAERTAEAEQLLWRKTCKQCHTLIFSDGNAAAENRAVKHHGALHAARKFRSLAARACGLRKLPRCCDNEPAQLGRTDSPASPPAARAIIRARRRRNRAASNATPITIPRCANRRTAIFRWWIW